MAPVDRPLFSQLFDPLSTFQPSPGSLYVYGYSQEARSEHVQAWSANAPNTFFMRIESSSDTDIGGTLNGTSFQARLRSRTQMSGLLSPFAGRTVYLDITGLEHHVWAPLLRSALETRLRTSVVYVEPGSYEFSKSPTEGQIFDLSEHIRGIAPLPGFATLTDHAQPTDVFVPMLGFEGTRLQHVIEHVQPAAGKMIPIIGVPGFRPEYPFHTFVGNRNPLLESEGWQNARFALANCPFSAFYELESIARERPMGVLRIAPIGTKPHGLGAILFKIVSGRSVELIYDHPVRSPKRTRDFDRLWVYDVTALVGA